MSILQTPLRQLIARPFVRSLHVRRCGETWTDDVAQIAQGVHHLRAIRSFIFYFLNGIVWIADRCLLSSLTGRLRRRLCLLREGRNRWQKEVEQQQGCRITPYVHGGFSSTKWFCRELSYRGSEDWTGMLILHRRSGGCKYRDGISDCGMRISDFRLFRVLSKQNWEHLSHEVKADFQINGGIETNSGELTNNLPVYRSP